MAAINEVRSDTKNNTSDISKLKLNKASSSDVRKLKRRVDDEVMPAVEALAGEVELLREEVKALREEVKVLRELIIVVPWYEAILEVFNLKKCNYFRTYKNYVI